MMVQALQEGGVGRSVPKGRSGGYFASHPASWRLLCHWAPIRLFLVKIVSTEGTDFKGYEIARDEHLNENVVNVLILEKLAWSNHDIFNFQSADFVNEGPDVKESGDQEEGTDAETHRSRFTQCDLVGT